MVSGHCEWEEESGWAQVSQLCVGHDYQLSGG